MDICHVADFLLLILLLGIQGCFSEKAIDVYGLEDLKQGFGNPKVLEGWVGDDPCQGWSPGVKCELDQTGQLRVVIVQLSNLGLEGTISDNLYDLDVLRVLDLSLNPGISGNLPSGDLLPFTLTHLNLRGCSLTGAIPTSFDQMESLEFLSLGSNQLSHSIPPGLAELTNLRFLDLENNRLSGPLPNFSSLKNLQHLNLGNNYLSGTISSQLGGLPLTSLLLNGNQFAGDLPTQLADIKTMEVLSVSGNPLKAVKFFASLPSTSLPALIYLSLAGTGLTQTVPSLKSFPNLQKIDLSHNSLSGSVPVASSFKSLSHLHTIDLSFNKLTGAMPDLSSLPNISLINMEGNSISDVNSIMLAAGFQHRPHLCLAGNLVCKAEVFSKLEDICGKLEGVMTDYTSPNIESTSCQTLTCSTGQQPKLVSLLTDKCECVSSLTVQIQMNQFSRGVFTNESALEVSKSIANGFNQRTADFQLSEDQIEVAWARVNISAASWLMEVHIFPVETEGETAMNYAGLMWIISVLNYQNISLGPGFDPYSMINFTLPDASSISPSPSANASTKEKKSSIWWIILSGILVPITVVACFVCAAWALYHKRRARRFKVLMKCEGQEGVQLPIHGIQKFSLTEILAATDSFDMRHKLGAGGYGTVYKVVTKDGQVLAVKRALKPSKDAESHTIDVADQAASFLREIELLSRLHHRNLIELVGYCVEGGEQLLVYPFMTYGNLEQHLQGRFTPPLSWKERLFVSLAAARGLEYLHDHVDPPIIHRDMKASNILLDDRMVARVADFGLSKFGGIELERKFSIVKGTAGYLDPEYQETGNVTLKSDVYGYGIVLLEIITAEIPFGQEGESSSSNFVQTIRNKLVLEGVGGIVDPQLEEYPIDGLAHLVDLALQCAHPQSDNRPPMRQVVKEIEEICDRFGDRDRDNEDVMIRPIARTNNRDVHFSGELFSSNEGSFEFREVGAPRHLAADILKSMSSSGRLQGESNHSMSNDSMSMSNFSDVSLWGDSESLLNSGEVLGREATLVPRRIFPLSKTTV